MRSHRHIPISPSGVVQERQKAGPPPTFDKERNQRDSLSVEREHFASVSGILGHPQQFSQRDLPAGLDQPADGLPLPSTFGHQ